MSKQTRRTSLNVWRGRERQRHDTGRLDDRHHVAFGRVAARRAVVHQRRHGGVEDDQVVDRLGVDVAVGRRGAAAHVVLGAVGGLDRPARRDAVTADATRAGRVELPIEAPDTRRARRSPRRTPPRRAVVAAARSSLGVGPAGSAASSCSARTGRRPPSARGRTAGRTGRSGQPARRAGRGGRSRHELVDSFGAQLPDGGDHRVRVAGIGVLVDPDQRSPAKADDPHATRTGPTGDAPRATFSMLGARGVGARDCSVPATVRDGPLSHTSCRCDTPGVEIATSTRPVRSEHSSREHAAKRRGGGGHATRGSSVFCQAAISVPPGWSAACRSSAIMSRQRWFARRRFRARIASLRVLPSAILVS